MVWTRFHDNHFNMEPLRTFDVPFVLIELPIKEATELILKIYPTKNMGNHCSDCDVQYFFITEFADLESASKYMRYDGHKRLYEISLEEFEENPKRFDTKIIYKELLHNL